jgi:outer membrane protein OmpA-like peptidoglycan-associated protein
MTRFSSRRFSAGYRYPRYSRHQGGAVRVVLVPVVLLAAGAGIYTYLHGGGGTNVPAKFVIAASGTANEPRPGLPGDITQELRSAGQSSTAATAYVLNPGIGGATAISLTPRLANGQVDNGPTRDSALTTSIARVQHDLAGERAHGPFDLLTTLAAATRAVPAPATLIVVSSGLSTSGGLDFRQAGWYASPSSLATHLKAQHLLPSLAGYHVVFTGLGIVDGRQALLPLPAQRIVKNYWMAICNAASAASCRVDNSSRPALPSISKIPVPEVPVLPVRSYRGPHHSIRKSLPDALLFAFDSATLLPSADSILQPLVKWAQRKHLLVSIKGSASPDGGTTTYNIALSQHRAQAVRDRMISLGLPAAWITKVTGVGTAGDRPGACLVRGHLDETICAHLRRVIITLTPDRNHS